MDLNNLKELRTSRVLHLCLAFTFFASGIIVNLIQGICYFGLKPFNKELYRKLNWYFCFTIYAQVAFIAEWWSGTKLLLYIDKDDWEKYYGKEHGYCIMNHSYEIDWLMGWWACDNMTVLGNCKAYAKKSIQYLPVLGWGWKFAEFVFLERSFEKDKDVIHKQIKELSDHPNPMWLLLFPEGTRFTPKKHENSLEFAKKNNLPLLKHHLLPRTRGFCASLPSMKGKVPAIYDTVIAFKESDPVNPTITNLLFGKGVTAHMYINRIPVDSVPDSYEEQEKFLRDMFVRKDKMVESFHQTGAKVRFFRPHTSTGLWALLLVPLSVIISSIKHPIILTTTYKMVTIFSVGLLLTSLGIVLVFKNKQKLRSLNVWSVAISIVIGWGFNTFLNKGWPFSIASGIFSSIIFLKTFKFLLSTFKESFTLGEAGIIAQGFVIFVFCTIENTVRHASQNIVPRSNGQITTLILQVGITAILLLSYTVYQFNISSAKKFYFTSIVVLFMTLLLPLQILLDKNPIFWIINQIFTDISLLKLIIFWSFCSGLATLAVLYQINNARKASTSIRKIFHILAVIVFIPGLLYECTFLYLATGVVLGIFFLLEIMRIQCVPPLGRQLQDGYTVFSDEKDTGVLALTPIYLLVGCALPMWIHPAPCDVTDSALFSILPLLSGLLSVGVGDTCASIVGSNYGKFRWGAAKKTVEGTLACIVSQLVMVYFMHNIGFLPNITDDQILRLVIAVVIGALVEAKTDQVDNLVLPLVMYVFLI